MNSKEAWEHVKNGGVVKSGGYTYYKYGYFAHGTYPGCLRGGDIDEKSFERFSDWKPLTEEDIIKLIGYKPERFYSRIHMVDSVDEFTLECLVEYLENNLTVRDYSNPMKNSTLCKKFFEETEE